MCCAAGLRRRRGRICRRSVGFVRLDSVGLALSWLAGSAIPLAWALLPHRPPHQPRITKAHEVQLTVCAVPAKNLRWCPYICSVPTLQPSFHALARIAFRSLLNFGLFYYPCAWFTYHPFSQSPITILPKPPVQEGNQPKQSVCARPLRDGSHIGLQHQTKQKQPR